MSLSAWETIAERSRKTKDKAGQPGGLKTEGTLAEKRNDPANKYCCPNFRFNLFRTCLLIVCVYVYVGEWFIKKGEEPWRTP